MSYPFFSQVQRAHSELLSEGRIKHRYNQVESVEDMGLLTRRAAFYVFQDDNKSHGIVEKESGEQSMGFAPDLIFSKETGEAWRVATILGGIVQPIDGDLVSSHHLLDKWTEPTLELAGLPDDFEFNDEDEENNLDSTEILSKLQEIVDLLDQSVELENAHLQEILKAQTENSKQILEKLNDIVGDAEEQLRRFLVLWMNHNEGKPPELAPGQEPPSQLILLMLQLLGSRPDVKTEDFNLKKEDESDR